MGSFVVPIVGLVGSLVGLIVGLVGSLVGNTVGSANNEPKSSISCKLITLYEPGRTKRTFEPRILHGSSISNDESATELWHKTPSTYHS